LKSGVGVDSFVTSEEIARKAIDECCPGKAFLNEKWVVPEGRVDFLKPLGHVGSLSNALHLPLECLARDRSPPQLFQRRRLFQIGPDLLLQEFPGHGLFETKRSADLVGVIDALDGLLGGYSILEGQIPALGWSAGQT
jgi:hypothetical protein